MKKDIEAAREQVKDVTVAIIKTGENWEVYLLNRSEQKLETVLVSSRGYGEKNGQKQETSVLRHSIPYIDAKSYAKIEPIDPNVFHLNNEYWISYYVNSQILDKKFIFVPDSIADENLTFIPELDRQGILHD